MCTSVAVGFYLRGEEDYELFKNRILAFKKKENCIFSIFEKKPEFKNLEAAVAIEGDDEDDFVLI